jgi:hypothetical protein
VHDPQQQQGAEQTADQLRHPVPDQVDDIHPPGQERAECHGRIDMTTGYRADHGDQTGEH